MYNSHIFWKARICEDSCFMVIFRVIHVVAVKLLSSPISKDFTVAGSSHSKLQFSSVPRLCPNLCYPMNPSIPSFLFHHQLPEITQTHVHRVGDNTRPSHPLLTLFSSYPQSLPASGSFPVKEIFPWGGQSIGVSASALTLPMNTQEWSLGWTGWISLQSKGLSRAFSNTTVEKHQFFSTQLSSQSNSNIHTWPLEKP